MPVALIINEGSYPKKGGASVGVSWQYCGTKGNRIDFAGSDGLYGNNYAPVDGLTGWALQGVFDVHYDRNIYLEEPEIWAPDGTGKGLMPTP